MARAAKQVSSQDVIGKLELQITKLILEQKSLNRRASSLQRRNLRLEELNNLKDEFIAVASHQLRTPATAVKQYLGLLLEGYADPLTDSQKVFLERAFESNERQLTIVDDLLQIARIDSRSFNLNLKRVEIGQVIKTVINEFKEKTAKKGQTIDQELPKKKVLIKGDAERLRMVFENILDNASNYSRDNTVIKIKLRLQKNKALITFEDQGVGIDKKDTSKLFQKFSRIPNPLSVEVGGTGLGLYWASRIVHLHGGVIKVKSKLGAGSSFTVVLPAA